MNDSIRRLVRASFRPSRLPRLCNGRLSDGSLSRLSTRLRLRRPSLRRLSATRQRDKSLVRAGIRPSLLPRLCNGRLGDGSSAASARASASAARAYAIATEFRSSATCACTWSGTGASPSNASPSSRIGFASGVISKPHIALSIALSNAISTSCCLDARIEAIYENRGPGEWGSHPHTAPGAHQNSTRNFSQKNGRKKEISRGCMCSSGACERSTFVVGW